MHKHFSSNDHFSYQSNKGFTLLQLLGVIIIIGVVGAILFPVLTPRGCRCSRDPSCLSNLKMLGLGIQQYTADYDEVYPSSEMPYKNPGHGPAQVTWDTALWPYVKSSGPLLCPQDSVSQHVTHPIYGKNASRSYSIAHNIAGDLIFHQRPLGVAAIRKPELTVVLAECDQPNLTSWGSYAYVGNLGSQLAYRHTDSANFLFCDGHARVLKGSVGGPYPVLTGYTMTPNGADCSYGATFPQ